MGLTVNLDEFSELCGVTEVTMRKYISGVEDGAVWLIERGEKGRPFQIEVEGGLAWWKARRDADEQASAERRAQLQQLRFEHLGDAGEDETALALSGKQRREEYAAVLERIKLRRTMGELIEVAEIEGPAAAAAIELRRQLMLVPAEFAAEAGLSPDAVRPLGVMIERAVTLFLEALPSPMRGSPTKGQADA